MRVLIIDDLDAKVTSITGSLVRHFGQNYFSKIDCADNLSKAFKLTSSANYDIIVLDIMLPYVSGGAADRMAGLELAKQIRSEDSINSDTPVICVSEYPDEVSDLRSKFETLGIMVIAYDDREMWSQALSQTLKQSKKHLIGSQLDFIIFIALEEERLGFKSALLSYGSNDIIGGLNVQYVTIDCGRKLTGALIKLREMGLVSATFECTLAINIFRPKIVCMSGICAGFSSNAKMGQLIIASPAWEYQAGKWAEDGFLISPHQIHLRPKTRALLDRVISSRQFLEGLERDLIRSITRPTEQSNPILAPATSGSAVIADRSRIGHIMLQHRKAAGLDMETHGIYFSCHESPFYVEHFFSIKCVVDFADEKKGDAIHQYGCIVSATAALDCIIQLDIR